MTRRAQQSGFTLLEVMIVVALIGVLAAIALPSFTTQTRKSQGDSEVASFFAEFKVREEQYAVENGKYLSTAASETAHYPATVTAKPQTLVLPTTWQQLRIRPPESTARCAYVVIAGTKSDAAGAMASGTFSYTPPAKNWFYVLAHCNLDNDSSVDSYYFISSDTATIQKTNWGR